MLGIFGGTFDPVHVGHLRTAFELQQGLRLAEVRLVVSAVPPHRSPPVAAAQHRWRMLQLALEAVSGSALVPDRSELDRDGVSYMVDTLTEIRRQAGSMPVCLLLGSDAFAGLDRWHRWRELSTLAHLVVVTRPGQTPQPQGAVAELWHRRAEDAGQLQQAAAGEVFAASVTRLEVSATQIRSAIARGLPADFLTPAPVVRYINENRLYAE